MYVYYVCGVPVD